MSKEKICYIGLWTIFIVLVFVLLGLILTLPKEILDQRCIEVETKVEYRQVGQSGFYVKYEDSRCLKWKY